MLNNIAKIIENIIKELARLEDIPISERSSDDSFPLPRMIDAGNGSSLFVSRQIDEDINRVAKKLMDDDPALKPRFTQTEWRAKVRCMFGPALASINLDDEVAASASIVLDQIKSSPGQSVTMRPHEFAFGCTLFKEAAISPILIGPVLFETRGDWLRRKYLENGISAISRARIEKAWQGHRLSKRRPSSDSEYETFILDAIDKCDFVCSVSTYGLAPEAGRDKALTAARLATTAIALAWRTPSKALNGINLAFDRKPHRQEALSFHPGKRPFADSSWANLPFSPPLKTGQWEKILSERSEMLAVVGNVLDYIISPTGVVARPTMMSALAHALLWFHQGCRETATLVAIVNFSASLDALACGEGNYGIRRLIKARLKIMDDQPIYQDGPRLRAVIDRIYNNGRSRMIHGTNNKLRNDWSDTRALAEQLAKLSLILCLDWIADNPNSDDPRQLSS